MSVTGRSERVVGESHFQVLFLFRFQSFKFVDIIVSFHGRDSHGSPDLPRKTELPVDFVIALFLVVGSWTWRWRGEEVAIAKRPGHLEGEQCHVNHVTDIHGEDLIHNFSFD